MHLWRRLFPQTLKYRLFSAFAALLLLPLCVAVLFLFRHFESIRQQDMMERMSERMQQVSTSLTDMMAFAYKTHIMLNQDEGLVRIIFQPDLYDPLERKKVVESKMSGINNSFFFHQTELYFKLIDLQGNVYTSYAPMDRLINSQEEFADWKERLEAGPYAYQWVSNDLNDVYYGQDGKLLSLYILLDDPQRGTYGLARISIQVQEWLNSTLKNSFTNQDLLIMNGDGEIVTQSGENGLNLALFRDRAASEGAKGYYKDGSLSRLVNYNYLEELDWYVVNQASLDELLKELLRLRLLFFTILGILVLVFVWVTFFLASRMTEPLRLLQQGMEEASDKKLRVKIRIGSGATREVLSLGSSFNAMIDSILELIQKLKQEERQKQAVRFQMLLTQMNPHFLLNTLNTVKWMARKEKQEPIAGICTSLGLILEASLNSEIELVALEQEIRLLRSYESVQAFRYQERFKLNYELDPGVSYALVPKLSLQPLVENAIVHGLDSCTGDGLIRVSAWPSGKRLILEVEDNGIGMEKAALKPARRSRPGIGLSNLKERLQLLFQGEAELAVDSGPEGTCIRISLPLLVATPYDGKGEDGRVDGILGGG
ncbi:MAG: histidine kinase [Paenibacillaceae bacterium]|jgi:sensor histidine kinase YesM|nr:histidine kinase [Paenibacillaceae bacterium]